MALYQVLSWHGIPSQVRAQADARSRERVSVALPARFQDAIDAAAMAARLVESDQYAAGFAWGERQTRDGAPDAVAAAVAAELDAQFPAIDWQTLARTLRAGESP